MSSTFRDTPSASARFEALVMPYLDSLFAFARHRTATYADAEDLVQETCARAWEHLDDLRDDGRARAWLFKILRRLLIDRHRTDTRQRGAVEITYLEAAHEELIAGDGAGPLEALIARLSTHRVRDALDAIPDDFAMAVALHDIAGFRYHEIAEILEVPPGTIMSRIYRGRKLLAGWIAADGAGAPSVVPAQVSRPVGERVKP